MNYINDELNGVCKEYYENGQVKKEINYRHNKKKWY